MTHNVPNIRTGIITKIESCYKSLEVKKKREIISNCMRKARTEMVCEESQI